MTDPLGENRRNPTKKQEKSSFQNNKVNIMCKIVSTIEMKKKN